MTIIYIAGVLSGIALVVIALVGWIRQSGKAIRGGDHYQAQDRRRGARGDANTGATPLEGYRANHRRGPDRPTSRAA